jgi:hypothetical protein
LARAELVVGAHGIRLTALTLDEGLDRVHRYSSRAADVHDLDLARAGESSYIVVRPTDSTRAASTIVNSSTSCPRPFSSRCSCPATFVSLMLTNSALYRSRATRPLFDRTTHTRCITMLVSPADPLQDSPQTCRCR